MVLRHGNLDVLSCVFACARSHNNVEKVRGDRERSARAMLTLSPCRLVPIASWLFFPVEYNQDELVNVKEGGCWEVTEPSSCPRCRWVALHIRAHFWGEKQRATKKGDKTRPCFSWIFRPVLVWCALEKRGAISSFRFLGIYNIRMLAYVTFGVRCLT